MREYVGMSCQKPPICGWYFVFSLSLFRSLSSERWTYCYTFYLPPILYCSLFASSLPLILDMFLILPCPFTCLFVYDVCVLIPVPHCCLYRGSITLHNCLTSDSKGHSPPVYYVCRYYDIYIFDFSFLLHFRCTYYLIFLVCLCI